MPGKRNLLGGDAAPLAVTGTGVVTAAGQGVRALERALARKECFLEPLQGLARAGAEAMGGRVPATVLEGWPRLEPGDDRAVPLAALAMEEALDGAALRQARVSLSIGTALGGIGALETAVAGEGGDAAALELDLAPFAFESFAGRLRRACASRMPCSTFSAPATFSVTCVSGLCALEQAAADLALGRADAALAGGVDALTGFMHAGFSSLGALSPSGRLRPFDVEHDGIVIGEAAAFLVVEPARNAQRSRVQACVVSQRLVSDAMHLTSPDPEGKGMARAIELALDDAALGPDEVGCVTVTAAGSAVYDRMESRAVHAALGPRAASEVPATTWEPAIGHVLAATGALGIVHAALTIRRGLVLAAFNVSRLDPECRLRYVLEEPVRLRSPCVLALTVGFGGQNGATVVTSLEMAEDLLARRAARGGAIA